MNNLIKSHLQKIIGATVLTIIQSMVFCQTAVTDTAKAIQVLHAINAKLSNLKTVSYNYKRDYFDGYEHKITEGNKFVEFNPIGSPQNLRTIISTQDKDTIVYNGSEYFYVDAKNHSINITYPPKATLSNCSYFYNSLISLRMALPAIINDTTIKKISTDTIFNSQPCYIITLLTHKKVLNYVDGLGKVTDDIDFTYKMAISKKTQWPLFVTLSNNTNKHTSIVYYSQIENDSKVPEEKYFFFSSYSGEKKVFSNEKNTLLVTEGSNAPNFILQTAIGDTKIALKDLREKVVVLEFFIKNCGPCIASVPKLNDLGKKYGNKISVIGINTTDKLPAIQWFITQYKPTYPIGINGAEIAKNYGVSAFPSVFIINSAGKIVFSGEGFDEKKIEQILSQL